MHLLILVTGFVLFPNAYGLKCRQCDLQGPPGGGGPEHCTETVCPASQICGAISLKGYYAMAAGVFQMKMCMAADQCVSGSGNVGLARALVSSKCCSTDLCNDQYPTPPVSASLNGKKCYSCTDPDFCRNIVPCSGDEDRCITATVTGTMTGRSMNMILKGCASKSMCDPSLLSLVPTPPGTKVETRCCEGDLCNGAASAAVSLLFLVAPVISLVLFN